MQSNIRRYYFYFLSDQAQIIIDHFDVLDELWGVISTGFEKKMKNIPMDPLFYNGVYGEILYV